MMEQSLERRAEVIMKMLCKCCVSVFVCWRSAELWLFPLHRVSMLSHDYMFLVSSQVLV